MSAPSARPASGRFERKFLVHELSLAEIELLVKTNAAHFKRPFPARWVNNIYLDTPGFENFTANVEGAEERVKLRIRWYGDLYGTAERPKLERKGKHGLLGTKATAPLPPLDVQPGLAARDVDAYLRAADLDASLRDEALVQVPVLMNRYHRSYWLSGDGRFRLTIDSELEFRPLGRFASPRLLSEVDEGAVVVEIKYDPDDDADAQRIAASFPFRMTKSSKYASGIERLLGL